MSRRAAELAALKADLIGLWDWDNVGADTLGTARFEAESVRRPRGGLAIGHVGEPGRERLEIRITAAGGPNYARALAVANAARGRQVEAEIKVQGRPTIPVLTAHGGGGEPLVGGRRRPLHIGASVAHHAAPGAGSLGAFVSLDDGGTGILSCSHVLARRRRGKVRPGDAVQQPGPPAPQTPADEVAHLSDRFAPLIPGQRDNLDAAVARIQHGHAHLGNCLPDLPCVPQRHRAAALTVPATDDELAALGDLSKMGKATGFTGGARISALEVDNLTVQFGAGGLVYMFNGVHELTWDQKRGPFAAPGDSGSLVFTSDGLRPVGLHFCAAVNSDGTRVSYVVPWSRIEAILGVRWLK